MEKLIFKKIIKDISLFLFVSITCVATIVWIIQAVNYLDLVSDDGHSLKVYFSYTLFSLPKILSNILPFMFMISLFYVIINYEINNSIIYFIICIIISSFFGDVFESIFKRLNNLKNSSNFLFSHGGFFDRFDSFILSIFTFS